MEAPVPTINTQRLRPFCQRTSRTVMTIHENGYVSMEILAKPKAGNQEGTQMVQESVFVSGDGLKMQIYNNNLGHEGEDGKDTQPVWTCQEYNFPKVPPKQLKKYNHVLRFVELVRSRTPKIVLITDKAKCKLMENSPPDFQVDFSDETSILLSKRKIQITNSDGNVMTSDLERFSHDLPPHYALKFNYLQQCMSECVHLEGSFDSLQTNGGSYEYFPITVGTNSSPVVIPSRKTSNLYLEACLGQHGERHTISENPGIPEDSHSSSFIQDHTSIAHSHCKESMIENIHSVEISEAPANENGCSIAKPFPQSYPVNSTIDLNYSSIQSSEQNVCQCPEMSIAQPNVQDGAISSKSNLEHLNITQDSLEEKMDENQIHSVPSLLDGFHQSCCPKKVITASVCHEQKMHDDHNKLKYYSETSPKKYVYQDENSISQQQSIKEEYNSDHINPLYHYLRESKLVPFSMNGIFSNDYGTDCTDLVSLPQNLLSTTSENSSLSIPSINPSFSDGSSIYQRLETCSCSKRNSIASSLSSFFSGVETSSDPISKDILDRSEISSFIPVQSSSLVTSSSDSDHRKMHRIIASPNIQFLEKHIESLDISGPQVYNKATQDDCKSAVEEVRKIASTNDFPFTMNTRPGSSNLKNSSVCNPYMKMKSRPDLFNRSLPLWHDSAKQNGVATSFPMSPQKQFMQSSDNNCCEQGHLDFSLPPQVRNSLDLSTSSNYSDSPSSSQSSSCEPLYQVFIPYTGWASYYASGAVWVLYNDGTQLGVKATERAMTFIDQDGTQKKFSNKDIVPDVVKMKLEKLPSILEAVLHGKR